MLRLLIILTVGLHLGGSNEVFANSSIFFHCKGPGLDYQTIFEHDEAENKLIQKIQKPDIIHQGRIASETKTTITEFEISRGFINYVKNNNRFSMNRTNGQALRDNQDMPVKCVETATDYLATKRAEIENAKTTTTEFWSPTTGH